MYGITNSGKLFADELTYHNVRCQCTISVQLMDPILVFYLMLMILSTGIQIIVVLSYVDDCGYWYKNEDPGTLGKRFHVNFLEFAHWFISIRNSQLKDHSISV